MDGWVNPVKEIALVPTLTTEMQYKCCAGTTNCTHADLQSQKLSLITPCPQRSP